jgi:nucleoside 2-deoxyribosyltransferase
MNGPIRIFISGVIQGSHQDKSIHSQDYRSRLKAILLEAFPDAAIHDPFEGHENSVEYDDRQARQTFLNHIDQVHKSDLLIAYLPHASLGTAIEVWESHKKQIPVWTISPMKTNWVVRFCSDKVFDDIDSFAEYLKHYPVTVASEK